MKNILFITIIMLFITGCTFDSDVEKIINNNNQSNSTTTQNSITQVYENIDNTPIQKIIVTSDVNYYNNVTGYLAQPSTTGNYPGVIIIHEWWGLNDNIKQTAEKIAAEGYIVLAVDLHNGKVAKNSTEARALTSALNQTIAIENMNAAYNYLKSEGATSIGSWGWCFGGGQSMQLALVNNNISATVIYYGNLETNTTRLENINWPILGIFGDKDTSIPVTKVQEFNQSINSVGIINEIYIYPNVGHAFANPTNANHAPNETIDAWNKTMIFLDKNLKK